MSDKLETWRPVIRDLIDSEGTDAFLLLVSEEISDIAVLSETNHGPADVIRRYALQAEMCAFASAGETGSHIQ